MFSVYSQYCTGNQMWKPFSAISFSHNQRVQIILQVDGTPQKLDSIANMRKLLN